MADWQLAPGVTLPEALADYRAVRASGPGGQNVNKVSTKVELRVPINAIQGMTSAARERLKLLAGRRLTQDGFLVIVGSESRHQFANKEACARKLEALVQEAQIIPKHRVPTRATKGSQERRLAGKKAAAQKKQGRGRVSDD